MSKDNKMTLQSAVAELNIVLVSKESCAGQGATEQSRPPTSYNGTFS